MEVLERLGVVCSRLWLCIPGDLGANSICDPQEISLFHVSDTSWLRSGADFFALSVPLSQFDPVDNAVAGLCVSICSFQISISNLRCRKLGQGTCISLGCVKAARYDVEYGEVAVRDGRRSRTCSSCVSYVTL